METKKVKVCILDSGVNVNLLSEKYRICGANLNFAEGNCTCTTNFEDKIGHGTAVTSVILNECPDVDIFCLKIFNDTMEIDGEKLLKALHYVLENIPCDIINISAGITYIDFYDPLNDVINQLLSKNTIVISAFDNNGVISYPAVMDNVIGVTTEPRIKSWYIMEDGAVDICIPERYYRVKWYKPETNIMKGSSFACGEVTGLLAKLFQEYGYSSNKINIKKKLVKYLKQVEYISGKSDTENYSWNRGTRFVKKMKKAIVFPFNKEIHALAQNEAKLSFNIDSYYDARLSGHCNKKISDICKHIYNEKVVLPFDAIDWNSSFDTVILGHCEEISSLMGRDFGKEVANLCQKHGKYLYSFDDVSLKDFKEESDAEQFFFPSITASDVPIYRYNKLRYCATPIIGIFGTSSKQGKFTLQNALRNEMSLREYTVAGISTEPNGYLLGYDGVFPNGYASTIQIDRADAVSSFNEMIWHVTKHNSCDVLLFAGQSGTIPYDNGSLSRYSFFQHDIICTLNMDCCLLCVNPFDDEDYIRKTIQYIESLSVGSVQALILFPVTYQFNKLGYAGRRIFLSNDELMVIKSKYEKLFSRPVYVTDSDIEKIADCCIDALSKE